MPNTLKQRLQADVKVALRAGQKPRVAALRFILATIKQREIDQRIELPDAEITGILDKLAKQRRDGIELYRKTDRTDLMESESFELAIIEEFLPQPMDASAIDDEVDKALAEAEASSIKEMGKVMAILKPRLQGRADMGAVSAKVKQRLAS